ncbi:MAG: GldG family protein [Kiritimatiellia bacterium]
MKMESSIHTARKMVWTTRIRKGVTGMHLGVNLLLLVLLWAMVNFIGMRQYLREDWSRLQLTRLSPKTESVMAQVEEPMKLILLMSQDFKGADSVEDLLKEYRQLNSRVGVEKVDPDRDIGETEDLRARFEVSEPDQLIVSYRDRHLVVPLARMRVMESDAERQMGQDPRMVGFRGEQVITSAVLELTRTERPVVYFLSGHGEKEIDNFENVPQGYSSVRERLEADHLNLKTLNLEETQRVPEDADLLVIAGPRTRISQPEIDLLRAYMMNVGRLLVLVDAQEDAGLVPFLKEFGIQLSPDVVVDPSRTLRGPDLHVTRYAQHSITDSMQSIRSIFIRPRSVLPAAQEESAADRPQYTALAASTDQGWAESEPNREPVSFDERRDVPGPIPIAAAVEWQLSGELSGENQVGAKRLVVFGDSLFPGNFLNNGGGMVLMQNAVNWLLQQEHLLEIAPKDVNEIRLQVNRKELTRLLLWVAVALPGAVLGLGLVVSLRRRG